MTRKERLDAYQIVTDSIVAELDAGTVPWHRPWKLTDRPTSLSTGRPYRGINTLLLGLTAQARGYDSPFWGTYRQIQSRGGNVRRGETATRVVFWKRIPVKDRTSTDPNAVKVIPFLRLFSVFNAAQADGLELPAAELRVHNPIDSAERIVTGYIDGPTISHGGDSAYYSPTIDAVNVPRPELFDSADTYYGTLFHELIHSTGHSSRLNRNLGGHFGTPDYSREELVAEIGACFLVTDCEITPNYARPASYIDSWRSTLANDPKLIATAAAAAQRAADRILGVTFGDDSGDATA